MNFTVASRLARGAAGRAAHQAPVEDDAGPDAGAGGQHHQRSSPPAGAEHPLAEGQRVDVVVDEGGDAEAIAEDAPQRLPGEVGVWCDSRSRRCRDPGARHADAEGADPDAVGGRPGQHPLEHGRHGAGGAAGAVLGATSVASTVPSRVTRPADVVVPPTSIPTTALSGPVPG